MKLSSIPAWIVAGAFTATAAMAQTLPAYSNFAPGDKLIYKVNRAGTPGTYEFTFSETSDAEVKGTVTLAGKSAPFAGPKHGYMAREFALSGDITEAQWSPPVKLFDAADKIGDKFTQSIDITLGNGTRLVEVLDSKVEKTEKVRVPAGEFDSTRVETTSSIEGKGPTGMPFKGSLKMSTWY